MRHNRKDDLRLRGVATTSEFSPPFYKQQSVIISRPLSTHIHACKNAIVGVALSACARNIRGKKTLTNCKRQTHGIPLRCHNLDDRKKKCVLECVCSIKSAVRSLTASRRYLTTSLSNFFCRLLCGFYAITVYVNTAHELLLIICVHVHPIEIECGSERLHDHQTLYAVTRRQRFLLARLRNSDYDGA